MERLENQTTSGNEKAIKIGVNVPADAISLGYFSADEITPQSALTILDLSETIPENRIANVNNNEAIFAYADEFGVLRGLDGRNSFPVDDLTISNLPMQVTSTAEPVDINASNAVDYSHYYYTSRHFVAAPSNFSLISLRDYLPEQNIRDLKIKVVDINGQEYSDANTGRKKYRLLLEPFFTEENTGRNELPHRVIVLFDADPPTNLQLVYDKVEVDEYGNFANQVLRFTETVNATTYYQQIPEEAFAIDPNYSDHNVYSVKRLNQKHSDIVNRDSVQPGYQIITPSKAIKDHRVFEAFNWRMIVRGRKSVNLEIMDSVQDIDSSGYIVQREVKCAVLHSSKNIDTDNSVINPYVFYRLQNSPFNLSKFRIVNPLGTGQSTQAAYWKVDIDNVSDLSDFDLLAWSPTSKITTTQAQKINHFLSKGGTIILDLSAGNIDCSLLTPQLQRGDFVAAEVVRTNSSSVVINVQKNGGWNLAEYVFEKQQYSVIGSNYSFRSSRYKRFMPFTSSSTQNAFAFGRPATSDQDSALGIVLQYQGAGDALSKGNIVATAFPLMSYCNNIYRLDNPEEVLTNNYDSEVNQNLNDSVYSAVLEGPFKLLYNAMTYALYSKAKANSIVDFRATLYNFVTPWKSSWVMDPNALFDDEKNKYFTSVSTGVNDTVLARDLTQEYPAAFDYYKDELGKFLPPTQQKILSLLKPDDLEFFVELTNEDVELAAATKVDSDSFASDENIPSSYNLFKIQNPLMRLYAYTTKPSPQLVVPSTMGQYIIADQIFSASESSSLENKLSVLNNFKSYPFDLVSRYSYVRATDKPMSFDVSLLSTFSAVLSGKLATTTVVCEPGEDPPDIYNTVTSVIDVTKNATNYRSAIDNSLGLWTSSTSSPSNCFLYTGDIDLHQDGRIWRVGSPAYAHDYVRYIQYSMNILANEKLALDGIYGSQTAAAVERFQTSKGERYLDGKVDSETKSFIAFAWKQLKLSNAQLYADAKAYVEKTGFYKYIDAVEKSGTVATIGTDVYQKLSFSGFEGPSTARDIIFFQVPSGIDTIDKIVIEPDSNPTWRNYVVDSYGYSSNAFNDIFEANAKSVYLPAQTTNPTINMGGKRASDSRYMFIHVTGGTLGSNFKYAEGFSIKSIKVYGKVKKTTTTPIITNPPTVCTPIVGATTINVVATIVQPTQESVSVYSPTIRKFNTKSLTTKAYATELKYIQNGTTIVKTFAPNEFKIGQTYSSDGLTLTLAAPTSLLLRNTEIDTVSSQQTDFDLQAVSIQVNPGTFLQPGYYILRTSAAFYSGSVSGIAEQSVEQYYLRDIAGRLYPQGTNTVTVNDGVLLLCNQNGESLGLLSESTIRESVTIPVEVADEEIDLRYGVANVYNNLGTEDGFIYGFYDLSEKEFLGKTVPYIDLIQRGLSNIYIGVCAIDADGNTQNKNEYLGPAVDMVFKPVNLPTKTIVPVFSLKYTNGSAIKVGRISGGLSKFDSWELPITNGSFSRWIQLDSGRTYGDWKEAYKGQAVLAVYSTANANLSVASEIFGSGYYDVKDDQPIIVNDKMIQARKAPIVSWPHPTDYQQSRIGITRPEVNVFIRESVASTEWEKIDYSVIRDVNCHTGMIEFTQRIVPSDPRLIKVSYLTENKNYLLRHIDGVPLPLNPILTPDNPIFDKPIYVYLKPTALYKQESSFAVGPSRCVKITEHEYHDGKSPIAITSDGSIFDKNSALCDPFLLPIAIIYVNSSAFMGAPSIVDTRVRGGGFEDVDQIKPVIEQYPSIISHWDVYPPSGKAYPKGGYIIIRIPESTKTHFVDPAEIYDIIRSNLTAGVVFDVQDLEGNSWS